MKLVNHFYKKIISVENLLGAWEDFVVNKRQRSDVRLFSQKLLQNILSLNCDLSNLNYKHASYEQFCIRDPKPRTIHKACVRDRLLHHAIYRQIQPFFDKTFIYDSYSCRIEKGTHKAFEHVKQKSRRISGNFSAPCFALKCDIKKYFDNVDHQILSGLLERRIGDKLLIQLLTEIIGSFSVSPGKGLPLGNLTSQLFANVYLDPLDKFVKHRLGAKNYIRYADDFLLIDQNADLLMKYFTEIDRFLKNELKLLIHPNKISLRKFSQGIDFVGYIALPHHSLPRKSTVKRIFRTLNQEVNSNSPKVDAMLSSYLGYLGHANAHSLAQKLRDIVNRKDEMSDDDIDKW